MCVRRTCDEKKKKEPEGSKWLESVIKQEMKSVSMFPSIIKENFECSQCH